MFKKKPKLPNLWGKLLPFRMRLQSYFCRIFRQLSCGILHFFCRCFLVEIYETNVPVWIVFVNFCPAPIKYKKKTSQTVKFSGHHFMYIFFCASPDTRFNLHVKIRKCVLYDLYGWEQVQYLEAMLHIILIYLCVLSHCLRAIYLHLWLSNIYILDISHISKCF